MLESKRVELPPPSPPVLVTLFTDNLVPDKETHSVVSVAWAVSKPHPYVSEMDIVRMFIALDRGGVEVYSTSRDGRICMRDLIPMSRVRLAQEAMPPEIFIDELIAAEEGADDDDEGEDEPEEEPETEQPAANGQATTS